MRCLLNPPSTITGEVAGAAGMNIHPVPATEMLFVEADNSTGPYALQLVDVLGRIVRMWTMDEQRIALDVRDEPRGVYVITLRLRTGVMHSRKIQLVEP
ncbi:MAG: T9SS type A sorting domain-containing protein [Flavobacteriales bacterium]